MAISHSQKSQEDRKTNFMILFLSSSNIISSILTIVSGLIIARWILPETLGKFNSYTVFSSYIILAQIGIPIALGRELPLYLGRNQVDIAERYARTAHGYSLILGVGVLIITSIISTIYLLHKDYLNAFGTFTVGILSFKGLYTTKYLKVLYRGTSDFNKLSIINIVTAVISFAGIYLVYTWDFYGLCTRALLVFLVDLLLTWIWRPTKAKAEFKLDSFKHLFKLGFPMFLVTNIYSLWPLIQKTLILAFGGNVFLGLYVVATMVNSGFTTVTSAISNVTYASMARKWGNGGSLISLAQIMYKPIFLAVLLFLVVIPIGWLILPGFIDKFIPNYHDGILAGQWMLIAGFVSILNVSSGIYNVVNRQKERLITFLTGFVFWFLSLIILYKLKGFSLEIFPQALSLGYLTIFLLNINFIRKFKTLTFE